MARKVDRTAGPRKSESHYLEDHADRRRKSRHVAESTFVVGSISGRLLDVSESGLGLEAHQALPVLKQGTFVLAIGRAQPQFRGVVRWCHLTRTTASGRGENAPVYRAGVALLSH